MRFIQRYKKPEYIGVGDNVRYNNKNYQVLINYIKGETDAKNYTLHGSIVQMVGRLGKQDLYHEKIRRLAFTAHMKESQYIVP